MRGGGGRPSVKCVYALLYVYVRFTYVYIIYTARVIGELIVHTEHAYYYYIAYTSGLTREL